MKAYLITTGALFGILSVLHVWRAVAEWPQSSPSLLFIAGMSVLVLLPAALAWWAWRLLRRL